MFRGFSDRTFEFFMAIAHNNTREFFHENHAWYEESVRGPLKELCCDLAPALLALDPLLEVRPAKALSHINRDLRFSNDKSPYRDYMWLGFHRAGTDKEEAFHIYADIGSESVHIGAGTWGDDRRWMKALRDIITRDELDARKILTDPAYDDYVLHTRPYARMAIPEDITGRLRTWYLARNVYLEHTYLPGQCMTEALCEDMAKRILAFKPLYDLMYAVKPVGEAAQPVTPVRPLRQEEW